MYVSSYENIEIIRLQKGHVFFCTLSFKSKKPSFGNANLAYSPNRQLQKSFAKQTAIHFLKNGPAIHCILEKKLSGEIYKRGKKRVC